MAYLGYLKYYLFPHSKDSSWQPRCCFSVMSNYKCTPRKRGSIWGAASISDSKSQWHLHPLGNQNAQLKMYELSLWTLHTWRKMGCSTFSLGQLGKKNPGTFVGVIYTGFSSFFFLNHRYRASIFIIQLGKLSQGVPLWGCLSLQLCILDLPPPFPSPPLRVWRRFFYVPPLHTPDCYSPCSQPETKRFIFVALVNKENPRQIFIPASF